MNKLVIPPGAKVYRLSFDSLEAYAERSRTGKSFLQEHERYSRIKGENKTQWYGTFSFEEAYEQAMFGWEKGKTLYEQYKHLVPENLLTSLLPAEEFERKWESAVAGSMIDMGTAGRDIGPLQFFNETENNTDARVGRTCQRIVFNWSYSFMTEEQTIFQRGIFAYVLVEHLETLGYSVELSVEITSGNFVNSNILTQVIKIKEFGEIINMDRALFALCSPSFFRRIGFGVMETLPKKELLTEFRISLNGFYGTCLGVATRQKPNTLIMDNNTSIEAMCEEIKNHYRTNAIEFEDEKENG